MDDFAIKTSRYKQLTEAEALDSDVDQIPTLTSYPKVLDFFQELERRRPQLEQLISRHLNIPLSGFFLTEPAEWVCGSFNVVLIIDIHDWARRPTLPEQAILRVPLPHKAGEDYSPGSVDEKLRCEAATYLWLQRHCPSIRTPQLLGVGFPGAPSFTAIENESLWNWLGWQLRRGWAWLHGDWLAPFSVHSRDSSISDLGYLLIEYITTGRPLSSTWRVHQHDEGRCANLYRGLANVLLDLNRMPLPRIGSWTMNNRGMISLTNRPLLDLTLLWGRHGIPTGVPRGLTYSSADSYILDLIAYQDLRMRYQPNAILGREDGIDQLGSLTALRALLPKYLRSRTGPFVLTLIDLHQSNIIVDTDWNIVGLIDFEFAPVQPAQRVQVPHWLSGHSFEQLTGDKQVEHKVLYDRFVGILEMEEIRRHQGHALSAQLREDWHTGRVWYNAALSSMNAFPLIFEGMIRPRYFDSFDEKTDGVALMRLWDDNCDEFIASKLKDNERYIEQVREIFAAARAAKSTKTEADTLQSTEVQQTVDPTNHEGGTAPLTSLGEQTHQLAEVEG